MIGRWLADAPVRRKVRLVILGTSAVTLLVASTLIFFYQRYESRERTLEDLRALAKIVASNSAAAVSFRDVRVAEEVLEALRSRRHLVRATLERDGRPFAEVASPERRRSSDGDLIVVEPVAVGGETLGRLTLRYDFGARSRELFWVSVAGVAGALVASILVAFLLSARVHPVITDPILRLAETARRVAEHRDFSERAPATGADEVGQLTDAFNEMLARIESQAASLVEANAEQARAAQEMERLHAELLDTSRRAGMAEVANGVLHNVGNVLNSVNVSARLLADRLRESRVDRVARLAKLLRDESGPAEAERVRYLELLGERLESEKRGLEEEIAVLCRAVDHMKVVVAMHQSYAGAHDGLVETVAVDTLCDDALRLGLGHPEGADVVVVREYGVESVVALDKHRVLQILVNLVRNARQALDARAGGPRRIVVRARGGGERIRFEVEDSGDGIAPENADRIFAHGFTTRAGGHGFGLHNSAIAAQELGGSLTAASEGPGRGALFVLELPCARPATEVA